MARVVVADRVEAAERHRRVREARAAAEEHPDAYASVTVRLAHEGDTSALSRLAERDGRPAPAAPLLVAEVQGRLLAARSLEDGGTIADPFVHSHHLAELLALRSLHLRAAREEAAPRHRARDLARRVARAYS
jgi:hypothetical protein